MYSLHKFKLACDVVQVLYDTDKKFLHVSGAVSKPHIALIRRHTRIMTVGKYR